MQFFLLSFQVIDNRDRGILQQIIINRDDVKPMSFNVKVRDGNLRVNTSRTIARDNPVGSGT